MIWNIASIPVEFPKVRLHIISVKLDGVYRIELQNKGILPALRGNDNEIVKAVDADKELLNVDMPFSFLRGGEKRYLEAKWEKTGVISVLWALFNILVFGHVKVHVKTTLSGLLLSKTFETDAVVPVRDIKYEWN